MAEQQTFYVVMRMREWSAVGVDKDSPFGILSLRPPAEFGSHWLPVFTTREEALEHYPGAQIVEVTRG